MVLAGAGGQEAVHGGGRDAQILVAGEARVVPAGRPGVADDVPGKGECRDKRHAYGPVLKYPIVTNAFYGTAASTGNRGFRLAFACSPRVFAGALPVDGYLG
jgi:hypothetical protein